MSHPDLHRLTAWVHELLEAAEARATEDHVAQCAECRDVADGLRDEARVIAREIAAPDRMAALKEQIVRAAERRPSRAHFWQIPVAAAVLVGLLAALLWPNPHHRLASGRVALEDGREIAAPQDFAASRPWRLRALEKASVHLSDRSTVDLEPEALVGLAPHGARGVQPEVAAGQAVFHVFEAPSRLTVCSSGGRVESAGGRFSVRIISKEEGGTPMKGMLAGALVTVFAGSISLSNANGAVEASPGQAAALVAAEAPLLVTSPQDKQDELLRRLEQLAARVAKLEAEVAQLETRNKQLKAQLAGPGGGVYFGNGGAGGGVRVLKSGGNTPGAGVIIELDEKGEKKDK